MERPSPPPCAAIAVAGAVDGSTGAYGAHGAHSSLTGLLDQGTGGMGSLRRQEV